MFTLGLPVSAAGVDLLPPPTVRRVAPPTGAALVLPAAEGQLAIRAAGTGVPFGAFVGLAEYPVVLVPRSAHVGNHSSAPASNAALAAETGAGRVALKPEEYVAVAEQSGATCVVGMHDALPCDQAPSRKRLMAESRTATWAQCIETTGGYRGVTSLLPLRPAAPHPQENPKDAPVFPSSEGGVCALSTGMGEAPSEGRRYLRRCIEHARSRRCVTWAHSLLSLVDTLCTALEEGQAGNVIVACVFPFQLARRGMAIELPKEGAAGGPRLIDLWDPALELDTSPLAPGCTCMPCRRHTRGYVHHMLRVHEMNAGQLVYEHNLAAVQLMLRRADALAAEKAKLDRQELCRVLFCGRGTNT